MTMFVPQRVLHQLERDHPEAVADLRFRILLGEAARLERKGRKRTLEQSRRLAKLRHAIGNVRLRA